MFRALTVAGSDSGGGAGIQADLKAFAALGVYGTCVVTAVTAQNTLGITHVHDVPPESIAAQLNAVLTDIGADAVKTGMLPTAASIRVVTAGLRHAGTRNLVVDPVMIASSGRQLQTPEALSRLKTELLPLALLVTPNIPEAEVLANMAIRSPDDYREAASIIGALGPRYVLIKGGHLVGDPIDYLFDGIGMRAIEHGPRIETAHTHGTGCTYSAAIVAGLARGLAVEAAVVEAKAYISAALRSAFAIGAGSSPVHHFYAWWPDTHGAPTRRVAESKDAAYLPIYLADQEDLHGTHE